MGGHPDGEVAAQLALQTMSSYFQKIAKPKVGDAPTFLAAALLAAHHKILRYAADKAMLDSPRTTVVAAVIEHGELQWIHSGDSRLYVVRGGELLTRTRDHSFSEQQAQMHGRGSPVNRNVLFTCLGSPQRPMFDMSAALPLQQGDKVMLCSDGLWSMLPDEEIVELMARLPVSESVPELAERALRKAGAGSDNVTVLALEWETPDSVESSRGISTDSIDQGSFLSTIQGEYNELLAEEELDDDAIERSIAEINEAIRRSAARKA
jgi:serine/threonine protein phosphatase PrpC